MYAIWIRIDDTLPWIEMRGKHKTKMEARRAVKGIMDQVKIKIVEVSQG